MNKIFWGLLFLFLNFNINNVDILPNFVGYLLIAFGMGEVKEGQSFASAKPLASGTAFVAIATWVMGLLGGSLGWGDAILGMISLTLQLMVTYRIAMGVKELELIRERDLGSGALNRAWQVMALGSVLGYLLFLLAPAAAVAAMIVAFLAAVYYIYRFYRTKTEYDTGLGGGQP